MSERLPAAGRARAWLQLLRVPNLLTVPGDPIAGFLLAAGRQAASGMAGRLSAAVAASLCFYAGGLLLNDVLDLETDRRERPFRPLPSGGASPRCALAAAVSLLLAGVGLSAALGPRARDVGLALAAAVVLYNGGGKRAPFFGSALMGVCRALSLLLGATAFPGLAGWPPLVVAGAGALGLYILSVTNLARREAEPGPVGRAKSWPVGALTLGLMVFGAVTVRLGGGGAGLFVAPWFLAGSVAFLASVRLAGPPERARRIPAAVGALLRALLPLQAALAWGAGAGPAGGLAGIVLLAVWPVSRILGRRFYMS
ncbi:MAG TPA: UbiA family prenyltransferase [Kiritimatiellia bacterium]|nr:UbiA family prenyltransferase [Kiritimatiellia bacterium]HRZ11535.1 UbiA family prenyltransferase [Kiritimatiellia bacterium]HSA16914.1 UbiA family prenyltransferase [Kiritimatiellia bacterium]